jgi:hypothetical protein
MAAALQRVADQHGGDGEQAEQGERIHDVLPGCPQYSLDPRHSC